MDELQTERRLEREARTVNLGPVRAMGIGDGPTDTARVEVTYQREGDIERCGFHIVTVPSLEATGDDAEDLERHPATIATAAVRSYWRDGDGLTYFSIDDVSAA